MGRGAVGKGKPRQSRYQLLLWRLTETWGLPMARWWSNSADELRQQAREGAEVVAMQGMYYELWDKKIGRKLAL